MKYIIVGYGNIGHKRQKVLGNKCLATVDIDPSKQADFIDSYHVSRELLKKIQSVITSTSQQPKLELVEYWLSQGKNVLVEKPFIITPKQGKKFTEIAKKNDCIWYTSYNYRFEPNIIKIKNLLSKHTIGKLYHGRLVYSFGNIKERLGTWRETKYGVLEEIAPHLLDFADLFYGYQGQDFQTILARKVESDIFDHWIFSTADQKLIFEVSAVTWKNIFSIDLYGQLGSIHMSGLNKWGGSDLMIRQRVFPSGVPLEKKQRSEGTDLTWYKDLQYFEKQVKQKITSLKKDLSTSLALTKLSLEAQDE